MEHLLFIVNPISGDKDKGALLVSIAEFCNKYVKNYTVLFTNGKDDRIQIESKISVLHPDKILVCGGDGTVNLVAQLVMYKDISIGIIPAGSANGLSVCLNLPSNINSALELFFKDKFLLMDALKVNKFHYIFHIGDFGFNAKMIQTFETGSSRGIMAYAKAFFRSLQDKNSLTSLYSITANDKTMSYEADMVVIANAPRYGTGAVISPHSRLNDGTFEIVVFKPIPLPALANLTLSAYLGSIENSPYVEIIKTNKAKIKVNKPQYFQVDGQLVGKMKKVKIKLVKNAVKVFHNFSD